MLNKLTAASFLALSAQGALAQDAPTRDAPTLDVIHWLTAGAESAAIQILADAVQARGGTWIDSAAPGGGGDARALLMTRLAGGDVPGASFLALGPEAVELGEGGALRDVRPVAEANGLDQVAGVMVDISTGADGALYALPIGLETQNLMFFAPKVFAASGVEMPDDWEAFLASAPQIRDAGYIPIAVGAQPWQLGILMTSVIVGTGGADLYRAAVMDHDVAVAGGPEMVEAFRILRELSAFADDGNANRAWNDTLNLVAEGRAAMQVMGSWAGAELDNMGMEQGTAWDCALAPGSDGVVVEGAGFMFPASDDANVTAGQDIFIQVLLDPAVQAEFAAVKGAVPPSANADTSGLSSCTQIVADALAGNADAGLATISASVSPDGWGQIQDLLGNYWADPSMTPETAAAGFADIIAMQQ